MTRIIHAELLRLVRRRPMVAAAASALVFSVIATLTVFSTARDAVGGAPSRRAGTTVAALAGTGGGTEAFAVGASFVGFLVFVTIIALIATEFSGGTFRAMVLREPPPPAGHRGQAGRASCWSRPASSPWPRRSPSPCR